MSECCRCKGPALPTECVRRGPPGRTLFMCRLCYDRVIDDKLAAGVWEHSLPSVEGYLPAEED